MSFRDVKIQPALAGRLQHCLRSGRLAHAWLFAGPRHSGKEEMARALAKALNCSQREDDACPTPEANETALCDSCRRIENGSHPDVYWLYPESKSRRIGVEQIREFESAVNLKPSCARVKVGVIVDADCMTENASNAFLKTLEEPPGNTVLVLLTTQPDRLLTTIRSRCLRLSFGNDTPVEPPYRADVARLLTEFSESNLPRIPRCYRLLTGLTGLLQTIRADIGDRIKVEAKLETYDEMESAVREKREEQMEARIEGEYRGAREQILSDLEAWFADILLCVEGADDAFLVHAGSAPLLRRVAGRIGHDQAVSNLAALERLRDGLRGNITDVFAFEAAILRLDAGHAD